MNRFDQQRGFSMVETLLGLAIGGMVLFFTGTLINNYMKTSKLENDRVMMKQRTQLILKQMSRRFDRGSLVSPGPNNSLKIEVAGKAYIYQTLCRKVKGEEVPEELSQCRRCGKDRLPIAAVTVMNRNNRPSHKMLSFTDSAVPSAICIEALGGDEYKVVVGFQPEPGSKVISDKIILMKTSHAGIQIK